MLQKIPQIKENKQKKTVNKKERKQAIHQTENDELPGTDGIPIEFYKECYVVLIKNLHNNIFFIKQKSRTKQ